MPPAAPFTLTMGDCLGAIADRLEEALRVTRAAIACAESGAEDEAAQIVMDLETYTYEADKLLSAVTILMRMRRQMAEGS